jgi:hypothetical protein
MSPFVVLGIAVAWLVLLLVWDYYRHQKDGMTISRALVQLGAKYPLVTYLVGFLSGLLCGHLYG